MEFWGNGIPEILLFTSILGFLVKKIVFSGDIFQKVVSKLSLKCNSCQQKRNPDGNKSQQLNAARHQTFGQWKTNGVRRNSQLHFLDGGIPMSFGGSVGIKYMFGSGHESVTSLNLEMKNFSSQIQKLLTSTPSTFDEWYHRKSGVVILSVCQWKRSSEATADAETGQFIYTKGINVEVSLATGSICAERVAISQAHTSHPDSIGRHNLAAVAVLHLSIDMKEKKDSVGENPKLPCGACQMWIEKLACQKDFRVIAYPDRDLNQYIEFHEPRLTST